MDPLEHDFAGPHRTVQYRARSLPLPRPFTPIADCPLRFPPICRQPKPLQREPATPPDFRARLEDESTTSNEGGGGTSDGEDGVGAHSHGTVGA